ncbi:hypothetical protein ACTU45_32485 [Streptomyces sp. 24-1644]
MTELDEPPGALQVPAPRLGGRLLLALQRFHLQLGEAQQQALDRALGSKP